VAPVHEHRRRVVTTTAQRTKPVCVHRGAVVRGPYRYLLGRVWDPGQQVVGWCLLNPSVADRDVDDPTVVRMMIWSRSWGFGGILVGNAFAQVATYPEDLGVGGVDPVGPGNEFALRLLASQSGVVVVAWGASPRMVPRGPEVHRTLSRAAPNTPILCLGRNLNGSPKHPLYLPYTSRLSEFTTT
jgi:hypothetical protein